jgi:DNA-binding response OmpR family regulator
VPNGLSSQPGLPGSRSILVVDDASIVRRLAYRLLSEAGYRVFEASSTIEALEVLNMPSGRVDLVLVDVVMPEVSGVDLVRLVRERWPGTRVLFMSAHAAEVLVREGIANPSVPFLAKPFTREELLGKVAAVLRAPWPPSPTEPRNPKRNQEPNR